MAGNSPQPGGVNLRRPQWIDSIAAAHPIQPIAPTLTRNTPLVHPSCTGTFVRVVSAGTLCQTADGCAARGWRTVREDW